MTPEEQTNLKKNNTHFDYYGKYAIAFSKSWGERNALQPVHYLNTNSFYAQDFSSLLNRLLVEDDLSTEYTQDIINRLAYFKPLRGVMKREISRRDSSAVTVEICKNFHDEREWRYIPNTESLSSLRMECTTANPHTIKSYQKINENLRKRKL